MAYLTTPARAPAAPAAEFTTHFLYLAACIVANRQLVYLKTTVDNGNGMFHFADPDGLGPQLLDEYIAGDPVASVKSMKEALKLLRDHIRAASGGGR